MHRHFFVVIAASLVGPSAFANDRVQLQVTGLQQPLSYTFNSQEGISTNMRVVPWDWLVSPQKPLPPGAPSNGPAHWGLIEKTFSQDTHFEISTPWPKAQHPNVSATVEVDVYLKTGGVNPSEDQLTLKIQVSATCYGGNPNVTCQAETSQQIPSSDAEYTQWVSSYRPSMYREQLIITLTDGSNAPFTLHDSVSGQTSFGFDLNLPAVFGITY